ncbi:MAG: betaine reductase, partial [Clostridia bacterium]|nr:betaine reductase [Clostridia bacterium]
MKLEHGNFFVKEVVFGTKTSYANGVLTINKEEALQVVREDEHITEADLVLARPGDQVRIVPVKEAIEPRCKVSGGVMFPGVIHDLVMAGS